ncbi:MAG: ATP-binding protein [Saprospiraceae bacterium]|jgi:signal transduction histidine kinase|nr:ATP-binding protein [Saprospiraceae bacterium]
MLKTPPFSNILQVSVDYFIHPKYKVSSFCLKKARLFVILPFSIIALSLFSEALAILLGHYEHTPYVALGCGLSFLPIWLFKKYGDASLSGNILTAIYATVVGEAVLWTGGLYSDNLLWLMMVPMMAMLFSGKLSGAVWLALLLGFTYYVYLQEPGGAEGFRYAEADFNNQYFLISFCLLFFVYTFVVGIFMVGNEILAKELIEGKKISQLRTIEATQKAEALAAAEAKLLCKNRELEQFAYAASHDLKEPLRMISAYSSLLDRHASGQLSEPNLEFLAFIKDGAARMNTMLDDLLEFAKLGTDGERAQLVSLHNAVEKAKANLAVKILESGALVKTGALPSLVCAETQMVRLFQNLISNAIKFAREGIVPIIQINSEATDGKSTVIAVRDNGIGIPIVSRERIFQVFERLHSIGAYEGSGIGLASCKKIVDNLSGKIEVVDSNGQGSVFKITIPQAPSPSMLHDKGERTRLSIPTGLADQALPLGADAPQKVLNPKAPAHLT